MPRQGYDAVDWTQIPDTAEFALGYVDGQYAWPQEAWDHFAALNIPVAKICVEVGTDADVLDCEPDNPVNPEVNPGDAVPWANRQRYPVIYCAAEHVPLMVTAFQAAHSPLPAFDVCDDTGSPHTWAGDGINVVCTQWNITSTLDYDSVADVWPGIGEPPAPPVEKETDMTMSVQANSEGVAILSWTEGSAHDVQIIANGALGELPQLNLCFIFTTGPAVIGNDNWDGGRIVIPVQNVGPVATCCGVIINAVTNPGTPYGVYANGE